MRIIEIPLENLREATWNPNRMDERMMARLRESIRRYGLVENLVVRRVGKDSFEVLSGNQRLKVSREAGFNAVPCVVVDLDDAHARLLTEALNAIQGEDDLGLKAELLRQALKAIPEEDILEILPETAVSLKALASMGQETIAQYLQNWQQAQAARLKHLQFQLMPAQLDVVEEALEQVMAGVTKDTDNPNRRGLALFYLC